MHDKRPIDFIRLMRPAFALSATVVAVGLVFLVLRGGLRLGIDFTGGVMVQFRTAPGVRLEEVRAAVAKAGLKAQIQNVGRPEDAEFLLKTPARDRDNDAVVAEVERALVEGLGTDRIVLPFLQSDVVGPTMGRYLTRQALWLLLFAILCILIYVSVRFKPVYAVGGVVALVHDVLIMVAALAVTGKELTVSVIAAMLTIVGYSINDTIVVYDRIREDVKKYRDQPFGEVVNRAVNETLTRTLITSLTTVFAALSVYLFGGPILRDFAFTLLVGLVAGTYSSIFIASALVHEWYRRKTAKASP